MFCEFLPRMGLPYKTLLRCCVVIEEKYFILAKNPLKKGTLASPMTHSQFSCCHHSLTQGVFSRWWPDHQIKYLNQAFLEGYLPIQKFCLYLFLPCRQWKLSRFGSCNKDCFPLSLPHLNWRAIKWNCMSTELWLNEQFYIKEASCKESF